MQQRTEQHTCDNRECDNPAPYGYICYQCVDELRDQLEEFTDDDLEELYEISLRDIRPAERNLRTTGNRTLLQDALNVVAWTLHQQITTTWPDQLNTLHRDENAVPRYQQINQGCKTAMRLIYGEPETKISPDHINDKMQQIGSMPPTEASEWLWEKMRIRISHWRIRKWNQRGQLEPRTSSDRGNYYHPADILKALEQSRKSHMSASTNKI